MVQGATRKSGNSKALLVVLFLIIISGLVWYFFRVRNSNAPAMVSAESQEIEEVFANSTTFQSDASFMVEEGTVLSDVFKGHEVPFNEIVALEEVGSEIFNFNNIQAGKEVFFSLYEEGSDLRLKEVVYQPDDNRIVFANQTSGGWVITEERIHYSITEAYASGDVDESLYLSAMEDGLDEKIIMAFADIFAWDVDFALETRSGDTYRVIYENKFLDGDFVRTGKVLAAEYINQGVSFYAFYFKPDGLDGGYFDNGGNSVEKTFLRAPVNYRYVSSAFSTARFHPVTKQTTPHNGVDYAAAYGTPIISVADGIVSKLQWHNAFGNNVEVRHNERYTTQYAHMSAFVKGMQVGDRVTQGEVIGYVGSTGFSTGNHVHYGVREYGSYVDPTKIDVPAGDPVPEEFMVKFSTLVEQRIAEIEAGI